MIVTGIWSTGLPVPFHAISNELFLIVWPYALLLNSNATLAILLTVVHWTAVSTFIGLKLRSSSHRLGLTAIAIIVSGGSVSQILRAMGYGFSLDL